MASGSDSGNQGLRIAENKARRKAAGITSKAKSQRAGEKPKSKQAAKSFDKNFGKGGEDAGF